MPNIRLDEIVNQFSGEHKEALRTLREVIEMFGSKRITGAERTAQSKYAQQAVGRGLAGSTVPAAVSAGMSADFEDIRLSRLAEAMNNLAKMFASPEIISHTATGGYGAQLSKEAQRFEQEQASFPSVISGNQMGLGYQPPSRSISPFSGPPGTFRRAVSGSVDGGSTWGQTSGNIAQADANRPRQTIAGMYTTKDWEGSDKPYTDAEVDAINDWVASEQGGDYSGVPSGPTVA